MWKEEAPTSHPIAPGGGSMSHNDYHSWAHSLCPFFYEPEDVLIIRRKKQPRPTSAPRDNTLTNAMIRFPQVMVIDDESGDRLGVMTSREAQAMADQQELDLVCVSPTAKPPVVKIMDYQRFKFEQQKKARVAKKNQKVVEVKEIRLSPTIDIGDFNTKLKQGQKFLTDGDKLKLSIRFKGRMIVHQQLGYDVLIRFAKACEELATTVDPPKMEGRSLFVLLEPLKK
jgi:translation initiation factor IF-3